MGKKNRSQKVADPGNAAAFDVNPFASLSTDALGIPKEEKKKPAPKPVRADPLDGLPEEDKQLLKDLGDASLEFAEPVLVKGQVSLQIQRKGKGGKTVTRVMGLKSLSMPEEMELLGRLKRELGTGATCREGVIELQGDQRERAKAWFAKNHYRVKGA
ncbi:MAG: translation initiation factor [Lentisphaeria bacterium]|nr:translation initiation factor [Lentisphaeria bacterium]